MSETKTIHEKPANITWIFILILLAIIADQGVESVLLETIAPLNISYGNITNTYLLSTMPFALILATLSDFHCRRKILIFTLISLSLGAITTLIYTDVNSNWIAYTAMVFKGIGGNVTPVALASLATIVPHKKFTLYLAIAICAYSIGIWGPIYLRFFHHLPLITTLLALVCTIAVIKWFRESEFDNFRFQSNTLSLGKFFTFLRKDVVAIALFAIGVPVLLALFGFIASEVSYYQILLRGEVLETSDFYSNWSFNTGISYYVGTFFLYLLLRRKVSDSRCLMLGLFIGLISIITSAICSYSGVSNKYVFNGLMSFFSIGFALFTPCLFSMLSKIKHKDEQGKIYGFLDTFDTLAAYMAIKYIGISKNISYTQVLWVSTILLFISAVFIFGFIRDVKERKNTTS